MTTNDHRLIILGLIIDLGGAPSGDRIGFRYWRDPGAMNEFPGVGGGAKARFLAFFSAFISAAYSYTGTETVILAAGEASNPSKQIPRAAKRVMYRIIIFCKAPCKGLLTGTVLTTDPISRRLGSSHHWNDVSLAEYLSRNHDSELIDIPCLQCTFQRV